MANFDFFSFKNTESDTTLASRYPFSLYLDTMETKSSLYLSFTNFDDLNTRIGLICLVFFMAPRNFLSEYFSLPSNVIFEILSLSPLSMLTSILTMLPSVVSGVVVMKTLVLKKPSFLYLFSI